MQDQRTNSFTIARRVSYSITTEDPETKRVNHTYMHCRHRQQTQTQTGAVRRCTVHASFKKTGFGACVGANETGVSDELTWVSGGCSHHVPYRQSEHGICSNTPLQAGSPLVYFSVPVTVLSLFCPRIFFSR